MAELNLGHVKGADGAGIPTGGSAGQILSKNSATDFDTVWKALTGADIPTSGLDATKLSAALEERVLTADIINDLISTATNKPLSAAQGKAVNDRVTDLLAGRTLKPTTLWEGTWSTGEITVPGIALYTIFVVTFDGWRPGFAIRNVGVNNIVFMLPCADGTILKIILQVGYAELNASTQTIKLLVNLAVGLTSTAVTSNALYNITRIAGVI
ncbi:MAG: hypothetical protein VB099_21130 [Candidatus Limiplasma sp.]|nr:hypothetical protein [Candidatus Limiplasma sp.]